MSLEQLRALIEKYLDSKGYQNKTRLNVRSYLKKLLDFMQEHGYEELNDTVISEYLKGYETTKTIGSRKLRVEEFAEYAKGERQIDMFENNAVVEESEVLQTNTDIATTGETETQSQKTEPETPKVEGVQVNTDMAASEGDEPEQPEPETPKIEPAVYEMLKKRKRKSKVEGKKQPKTEDENRTQISSYLSNEVYAGIKALSLTTGQPISDIVAQVVKAFYEDNTEVINESIRTMQQLESVKSRIKYHR